MLFLLYSMSPRRSRAIAATDSLRCSRHFCMPEQSSLTTLLSVLDRVSKLPELTDDPLVAVRKNIQDEFRSPGCCWGDLLLAFKLFRIYNFCFVLLLLYR